MRRIAMVLTLLMAFAWSAHANVDLVIGDGMLVETVWDDTENDFSTYIELSGDLTETGTGYLLGKITSGERGGSGFTQFAGLDWGSGFDNTTEVTRYTGQNYPLPGSTPPLNPGNTRPGSIPTRFYSVNSTASELTGLGMSFAYNGTREGNPSGTKLIHREAGGNITVFEDGSTSSPIPATGVSIPAGMSWWYISPQQSALISARICFKGLSFWEENTYVTMLERSENQIHHTYRTTYSSIIGGYIPVETPFNDGASVQHVPEDVVDWVWLSLRTDPTDEATALFTTSAFVDKDGYITDLQGNRSIPLDVTVQPGEQYHLLVRHPNHVAVSSTAIMGSELTSWDPGTPYDFTGLSATNPDGSQFYTNPDFGGNGAIEITAIDENDSPYSIWCAVPAEPDLDNYVDNDSENYAKENIGDRGYPLADYLGLGYVENDAMDLAKQVRANHSLFPLPDGLITIE